MNLWKDFRDLVAGDPLLVGTVLTHHPDGTSTVQLPHGGTLRAQGQQVQVGSKAFVRSSRVQGEAPDLPTAEISV